MTSLEKVEQDLVRMIPTLDAKTASNESLVRKHTLEECLSLVRCYIVIDRKDNPVQVKRVRKKRASKKQPKHG